MRRNAISTPSIQSFVVRRLVVKGNQLLRRIFRRPTILHLYRASRYQAFQRWVAQGKARRFKGILRLKLVLLYHPLMATIKRRLVIVLAYVVGHVGRILGVMRHGAVRFPFHVLYPRHYRTRPRETWSG